MPVNPNEAPEGFEAVSPPDGADEAVGHLRRALSAAGSKARLLCVKRVEAVTTSTSGD